MAGMQDPLTDLPPPSRLDLHDLNNFTSLSYPPLSHSISWAPWILPSLSQGRLHTGLFLLASSHAACHLLHHSPNKKFLGSVGQAEGSVTDRALHSRSLHIPACDLYALDDLASVIIATIQYSVPILQNHAWVKLVFGAIEPENVLMLAPLQSDHFRGKLSADDRLIFKLETDCQRLETSDPELKVPYLPSGSLVDGIAAAVLTHCQLRRLRGRLLLSWPDCNASTLSLLASILSSLLEVFPAAKALDFSVGKKAHFKWKSVNESTLYI
eukprot:c24188_g1_i1 orf=142-948(+)